MSLQSFLSLYRFDASLARHTGIEREFVLTDDRGNPVPKSPEFLRAVQDSAWTYELSACQVEHRTQPHGSHATLRTDLEAGSLNGQRVAQKIGCVLSVTEVAPWDMPLDVYPDNIRYQMLATTLPREVLRSACRVMGLHIHRGVCSMNEAIDLHNALLEELPRLTAMGDHSNGERLRLYGDMAIHAKPCQIHSVGQLYERALSQGFVEDPRRDWSFVRISSHGTVEIRVFGMTDNMNEILEWVREIERIHDRI